MPSVAWTPLANITLTGTATSVTFSSISQDYKDLVLIFAGTGSAGADEKLQFNSDTGSNYNWVRMWADSAANSSATAATTYIRNTGGDLNGTNSIIINILDYSATNKHKTTLGRGNNTAALVMATGGRWANTAAITTITYSISTGTFSAGSSFALYGVSA